MPTENASETTRLLAEWCRGNEDALAELMPRVYDELRRTAAGYLRHERTDHTLQTSALVHETYLRLIDQDRLSLKNRSHFLGIAAQMMRRILVDYARRNGYAKRGGDAVKVPLDEAAVFPAAERSQELVALDDALATLATLDPQQARIVEMRYFGGLNVHEIAAAAGISVATVTRKWNLAKAWLYRSLVRR